MEFQIVHRQEFEDFPKRKDGDVWEYMMREIVGFPNVE